MSTKKEICQEETWRDVFFNIPSDSFNVDYMSEKAFGEGSEKLINWTQYN